MKEHWSTKQRKEMNELFKSKIDYDKKCDIFYLWIGGKGKVDCTLEISDSIRLDIDKRGIIFCETGRKRISREVSTPVFWGAKTKNCYSACGGTTTGGINPG